MFDDHALETCIYIAKTAMAEHSGSTIRLLYHAHVPVIRCSLLMLSVDDNADCDHENNDKMETERDNTYITRKIWRAFHTYHISQVAMRVT